MKTVIMSEFSNDEINVAKILVNLPRLISNQPVSYHCKWGSKRRRSVLDSPPPPPSAPPPPPSAPPVEAAGKEETTSPNSPLGLILNDSHGNSKRNTKKKKSVKREKSRLHKLQDEQLELKAKMEEVSIGVNVGKLQLEPCDRLNVVIVCTQQQQQQSVANHHVPVGPSSSTQSNDQGPLISNQDGFIVNQTAHNEPEFVRKNAQAKAARQNRIQIIKNKHHTRVRSSGSTSSSTSPS